MRHMFYGQFWSQNSMVVSSVGFETNFGRLQVRSGQGQVKKGQILKLINLNKKGVYLA